MTRRNSSSGEPVSYRLEAGLALLLATAIGVAVWAASRKPRVQTYDDSRASTFLSGPRGAKGLHQVLIRMGRPSDRRRTALFTLTERPPAILAVVDPPYNLQDAELDEVVAFVLDGGAVVSVGRGGGITRCTGWQIGPDGYRDDSVAVARRGELNLPRVARWLTVRKTDETESGGGIQGLVKGSQANDRCGELVPTRTETIVIAVNGRPVIQRFTYANGGTITLAADEGWFTNSVWRSTDVPLVVLPLLTPRAERPGRVAWDEYHQGFGSHGQPIAGRIWTWLTHTPAGWALLQLIAVALMWLAITAVRFGPARHVIVRKRRSPIEHLEALGAGLESAADADTAVQRLALGLRRRLNRTGQLASADVDPWLESLELATRGPRGRTAVRRLRHLIIERDRSGERVLAAAQAVEDVWEELRPRKTRD